MRPRKNPLPLSMPNVLLSLKPGRAYTVDALVLIFAQPAALILECLHEGLASGAVHQSTATHGFRRTFWVPVKPIENIATRRAPPPLTGNLTGYDAWLKRLRPKLCCEDSR